MMHMDNMAAWSLRVGVFAPPPGDISVVGAIAIPVTVHIHLVPSLKTGDGIGAFVSGCPRAPTTVDFLQPLAFSKFACTLLGTRDGGHDDRDKDADDRDGDNQFDEREAGSDASHEGVSRRRHQWCLRESSAQIEGKTRPPLSGRAREDQVVTPSWA